MTKAEHQALVDELLTLMEPTTDRAAIQRACEIRNILVNDFPEQN